ncbi:MAG TPA: hypothetical protein PKI93_02245 [Alphaproteobacteria bacterium]|nr:hypothetical protein [Alphaproteobacteria bacterium]HNS43966.1 hypothetical protein [Alphaproteobacteria bacterium]
MTMTREEALGQIKTLIAEHKFTQHDLISLFTALPSTEESGNLLQRVMIYIGGAFVFMGICVYIGMIWDDLDSLSRVIVSLGSGFIAFILGLFTMGDQKFVKAATPLFLIASALEPTGLFVFMDEYLPPSGNIAKASTVVFLFMLLQMAVALIATNKTSLLFFTTFFFFAFLHSLMSWVEVDEEYGALTLGLSGLMVAWGIGKTQHAVTSAFYYFWGATFTAAAAFDLLEDTPADVLLIGVSAAIIYLSTLAASRTLLTVGVISLLAYLGYFTDEYFKNIVGWPIALIVLGLIMIGISIFAVKLGKKIKSSVST